VALTLSHYPIRCGWDIKGGAISNPESGCQVNVGAFDIAESGHSVILVLKESISNARGLGLNDSSGGPSRCTPSETTVEALKFRRKNSLSPLLGHPVVDDFKRKFDCHSDEYSYDSDHLDHLGKTTCRRCK